jgi:hypothetical protein
LTLPNKPSELLRLALADLRKVERDERYEVDMWAWHAPDESDNRCHVCLAGAVIAGTLGARPDQDLMPGGRGLDRETGLRLEALDALRCGDVTGAVFLLLANPGDEYPAESNPLDRETVDYEDGREAFHEAMAKLAADLEGIGL